MRKIIGASKIWICGGVIAVVLIGCRSSPKFDKSRFDRMQDAIESATNHLIGVSLADASKLLSLENVKWDAAYSNWQPNCARIYHFEGFYLLLSLDPLPKGITPDQDAESSMEDSETGPIWWVAEFYPALIVDGLDDPAVRMTNYWSKVREGFRKRNEEMKRGKRTTE